MRRREFISLVGGTVAWPITSHAQQPDKTRLIGVLMGYAVSDQAGQSEVAAFRAALAKLGWTEGSNLRIELRWGNADPDRIRTLAKELIDLRPDVILSHTTLVMNVGDPIASGFAASLARPGGNITGLTVEIPAHGGKWVELLKEIAPRTVRMALLFNPATAVPLQFFMPSIQAAASSLAIQISNAPVHAKDEIEGVIAAQARNPGGGLIVMPDPFNVTNRDLIIALAARYGVPAIYWNSLFRESGGLITYGADFAEQFRQAPEYIDRILKGAKPANLPIQAPTKFGLVINLKTAKALNLEVPPLLLGRADEVIE
jgi:putative tryptophan/tyrosine transport system substrate-binding protein